MPHSFVYRWSFLQGMRSAQERRWRRRSRAILRIRKNLGRIQKVIEIPNLIDIQKTSYDKFLQSNGPSVSASICSAFRPSSVASFRSRTSPKLEFARPCLVLPGKPKYDVEECRQRGMTYAASIKVTTQLARFTATRTTQVDSIVRNIAEQEVYFRRDPTDDRHRNVHHQPHRARRQISCKLVIRSTVQPWSVLRFTTRARRTQVGKLLYSRSARSLIAARGSTSSSDPADIDARAASIGPRRKMHATVLLRALGYSTQDLLNYFYNTETVYVVKVAAEIRVERRSTILLTGQRSTRDIAGRQCSRGRKEHQVHQGRPSRSSRKARSIASRSIPEELQGKVAAHDVVDNETGEVLLECNEEVTPAKLDKLRDAGIGEFKILFIDGLNVGSYLRDTLLAEKVKTTVEDAIMEIYRHSFARDPPTRSRRRSSSSPTCSSIPSATILSRVGRWTEAQLQIL